MVHGCMVYTECAETAAVLFSTNHVTAKQRLVSTRLPWVFKRRCKNLVTHLESPELRSCVKVEVDALGSRL